MAVIEKKTFKPTPKGRNRLLFYCAFMIFPVVQLGIFYFGINLKSILMSFQKFDMQQGAYVWNGLDNFKTLFQDFSTKPYFGTMVRNTLLGFFIPELVTFVPSIMTSYYVFKKFRFSKFFQVVMYLPSILSVLAMSLVQYYMLELGIPNIISAISGKPVEGLVTNPDTAIGTLIGLSIWFGFCQGIMIYPATMSSISDSIIEAAKIDGCSVIREFAHVVVPMIWPTVSLIFVTGCNTIFTVYMPPFILTQGGPDGKTLTIGYIVMNWTTNNQEYMAATAGIVMSMIGIPLILLIKWGMSKVTPVVEY